MSIINGTAVNNTLTGTDEADQIFGFEGDDVLEGGLGDDLLDGGSSGQSGDTADYSTVASAVSVNLKSGTASGGAGNDTLISIENIIGSQYNDMLIGNAEANNIYGGNGNDTLDGGVGNDHLYDGSGNDTYLFGLGSGQDTVNDYDTTSGNLDTVQLDAGIAPTDLTLKRDASNLYININGTADQLTLANWFTSNDYKIEQVKFTDGTIWNAASLLANIREIATDGDDYFAGNTGANTFSGLKGNDTYVVDNAGDVVNENPDEGWDTVQASISYTLAANVENLTLTGNTAINGTGNALNNNIIGNNADNILDGSGGNDSLYGNAGNDTYLFGIDSGQDTISDYDTTPGNQDIVQLGASIATTDVIISRDISNLYVKINGTADQLTLLNWFTSDVYKIEQIKFADSTIWDAAALLANIREIATDGDDYFTGDTGANIFSGLKGNDTYVVDNAGDVVNEKLNEGTDKVRTSIDYTLPANVENLTLTGNAAINGTGNELNNSIFGNSADNILDGGAGNDWLYGNSGNDIFLFGIGSGQDTVHDYNPTPGNQDTVQLDAGIATTDVTISRDTSNLYVKINGTADQLTLLNWFINDDYKIEKVKFANGTIWDVAALVAKAQIATDGDDYLTGDSGANALSGLKGNDTYIVDNAGDVVNEKLNEGTDKVQAGIDYTLPANVENLILTGNVAIYGTGNKLNNSLYGNSADNILDGGAGNDWLFGSSGNDIYLFGIGSGQDTVSDYGVTPGNHDTVQLGTGIAPADVTLSRDSANLYLKINGTADQLTLLNWFAGDGYKIEQVKFADGTLWNTTTLSAKVLNLAPTLTGFASTVASGNAGSEITVTFADIQNQGNEADGDGAVTSFVIKAVNSGTLKIGNSAATATAWAAGTNDVVDASHQAYWTPATNVNGALNAFTVVAKDNDGLESASPIQATVAVADTAAPTVTISDNLPGTANITTTSIAYTLTFSESVTGLEADDFTITNGIVSSISGSGSAWTANVKPALGVTAGAIGLTLKTGAVSDGAGNLNASVTNASQAIDTSAPVAPQLVTNNGFNFLVDPQLTMQTSLGTVVFELNPEQAPVTVANMFAYANTGFYDNTLFHRVVPGFVVQGGGFTSGLNYKTPAYSPIVLESDNGLSNLRGTIAMARTSVADSATSQFFVNLVDNLSLNYSSAAKPGYAVFGKVVSGLPVIDSIALVSTTTVGSNLNVPMTDITITSVEQTLAGSSITNLGTLAVSGLENGAQWSYSLDSGATWTAGTGNSLSVPVGSYAANAIQVRQTDTAGNVSASAGKLTSALVVDTTAPTVTSFSPTDGAAAVNINSNIVMSFSEPIQAGTGNFSIVNADGTVAKSIAVTDSSQVSISGSTVIINPSADLAAGKGYYINSAAGVIKDLAGNSFAGITGKTAYNFTTGNNVIPSLTAFAAPIATGNEDSSITVTFAKLQSQGNEADVDGTVTAFVIKAVNSGALTIGSSAATASAWNASSNNIIDANHQAFWTPAANANGTLNAFTAAAKDNDGAESSTAIQAKIAVAAVNDPHTGTVTLQGSTIAGQTLTTSQTLADLDGLGAVNYQWQASTDGSNWSAINGATANSLQLTRAQSGQFIRMHASYIDGSGTLESQDSAATNKVTPPTQVIFGTHDNDTLAVTTADDSINGGFGFDTVRESGALTDYAISQSSKSVVLTNNLTAERDVLTDIERVTFVASGDTLTIAYTEAEAVARHLMTTWLHRDLSVFEGGYVLQHLSTYSASELANVFLTLPEASGLASKSSAELLAGYESHPLMQRLSAVREVTGGDSNDQITVSFGVSVNIDSGHGHDIVTINEALANMNVAISGDTLELTRHADGAMVDLKNVEMVALANGETMAIAHDWIEGALGRLVHTFFDRNASVEEWQLGQEALAQHIAPDDILNWFQGHAGLTQLSDSDYVQTLYQNTFNRAATATEQNDYVTQLHNGSLDRNWLAVDLALSQEAVTVIGSQVLVMAGWV